MNECYVYMSKYKKFLWVKNTIFHKSENHVRLINIKLR